MGDEKKPNSPLRPSTAGVHVTEHPAGRSNPTPVALDETDVLIEEYLSPRKLRALTGIENLEEVKFLEMRVDTSETSLGNFGALLPHLTQLKLSNSIIANMRDLGSSFPVLRVLWMPQCNLECLDGVTAMANLKELYLAYNDIHDLSPLSMMDSLEILDLEGNNISDISQVEFLSLCTSLKNLTLEGNPICVTPHPEETAESYDYRSAVKKTITNLKYLDDEPLLGKTHPANTGGFASDWRFLAELENEGTICSVDSAEDLSASVSSPIRPSTGYRPGTSLRPTSTMKRLGTARIIGTATTARPKTGQNRPSSSDSGTFDTTNDVSELTTGALVCGNPSSALRARKKRSVQYHDQYTNSAFAKYKHTVEHTFNTKEETGEEEDSLLEELKEWRLQHETVHKKLEESRAPNILTIDHTENVESSSSEGEEGGRDDQEEDLGFSSRQDNQASDEELLTPDGTLIPSSPRLKPSGTIGTRRRRYKPSDEYSPAVQSSGDDDFRPVSGPAPQVKYRLPVTKTDGKHVDQPNGQPIIIRADIRSPEKPVIDRSSKTARAAVFSSMKRHVTPATLPSRPSVPK